MAFKGSYVQGDEFISPDVLKQLIDNDNYLYKVAPTITLKYPASQNINKGQHSTRGGDAMRITAGSVRFSKIKGYRDYTLDLPAIKAPGPPVVLLTIKTSKGAPAISNIIAYSQGYKSANIRIQVLGGKTAENLILHYAVIHGVPDN